MLFHFHEQHKSKKPGSTHAVYLLSGFAAVMAPATSAPNGLGDGEDAGMPSSPFMSSSMPQKEDSEESLAVRSVAICREEDLEGIKKTFHRLTSIHVYSLGPSAIQNLQILADCNQTAYENYKTEDPLKVGRQYGLIQNARVSRRTAAKYTLPAATSVVNNGHDARTSSPAMDPEHQSATALDSKNNQWRTSSQGDKKPRVKDEQHNTHESKMATKTPVLRREHSDIFKSFAKPRSKITQETTGNSAATSPAPQTGKEPVETTASKSGSESQVPGSTGNIDQHIEEASPVSTATTGGRRRGRRKVMKKKMLKDEEGYLGISNCSRGSLAQSELTSCSSDKGRTCMGILLGRRTSAQGGRTNADCVFNCEG
ncbi:MAG: hypothetical protein Q9210_000430 [Variospora velana]